MTEYEKLTVDYINTNVGDYYPALFWLTQYRIAKFRDEKQGANPSGDQLATITIDAAKDLEKYTSDNS